MPIQLLKPGMILLENIYDLKKVLLISSGTVLTNETINTIKKIGYIEINVMDKTGSVPERGSGRLDKSDVEQFKRTYSKMQDEIAGVVKFISDGNQVDINKIQSIPRSLMNQIGSTQDIFAYLNHVSILDDHTMGHSINVSMICGVICEWIKVSNGIRGQALAAGVLHDVGKSLVPAKILNKPGPLSAGEWLEVKKHPVYGYQLLKKSGAPDEVLVGALMHHEREDGSGYPLGINHQKIPLVAKIVAIADIYDAMTSDRSYRAKLCPFHVIRQFQNNYFGVLDTKILMTFLARIAECYIGELVALTDGTVGEIVFIPPAEPAKPLIKTAGGLIDLQVVNLDVNHIIAH